MKSDRSHNFIHSAVRKIVLVSAAQLTVAALVYCLAARSFTGVAEAASGVSARTYSVSYSNIPGVYAGVGSILDPGRDLYDMAAMAEKKAAKPAVEDEKKNSRTADLVMANVNTAMNVRVDPDENADKAGVLYKDCGGRILERKDGWTKLVSGDLTGWAKDDYLLFGEDAEELAGEVGVKLVSSKDRALALRIEPDDDSELFGVITESGEVDMLSDLENGWISVVYNDTTCYVKSDYVEIDFRIDEGETMEVIKAREEAEKERQRQILLAQGILPRDSDETRLLAALIQCEAGNQPYEGKVAVGAVVMNRLHSGAYASTMYGVIYASGQFSPARNGLLARRFNSKIMDSCMQAAQAAMAGESPVGGALHVRRVGGHDGGQVIGDHVFW